LLNFPVSSPANGALDAVTGQKIHYDPKIGANSYLTNGYSGLFALKSGGLLTTDPLPSMGTVIILR
jgi:hypothetical protein